MTDPASILFITVSRIGDTLFATPALRAIAARWPQAEITVLGHPKRVEVFEHLPWVARLGAITKASAFWKRLGRRRRFDLAFVFGFDSALVDYALAVSRQVVAFRQNSERINARLLQAVAVPAYQSEHAVRQLLRLPQALGIEAQSLRIAYRAAPAEIDAARRRLGQCGFAGAWPLIGLQVASFPTKGYRDWPIEHFRDLCLRILARWPQARFLIFGGAEEKQRTAALAQALGDAAADFSGRLTLRESGALMACISLYVGVDTGPTHIMSAYDTPMIALYHCLSSSRHTGPLQHPAAWLIDHPHGEAGCSEQSTMAQIDVETVFAAVKSALGDAAAP